MKLRYLYSLICLFFCLNLSAQSTQPYNAQRAEELKKIKNMLIDTNGRQNYGFRMNAFNSDFSQYSYLWFSSGKENTPSFNLDKKYIQKTVFLPEPLQMEQSDISQDMVSAVFPEGGALAISENIPVNNVRRRVDTVIIFTPGRRTYDGSIAGIKSYFTPFKKLCHVWLIPEGFHYFSYTCNRAGNWIKQGNLLTFVAEEINNVFFEIKVLPDHLHGDSLAGRKVQIVNTQSIKGNYFDLHIYDPAVEDEDVVSIYYNGEKVISHLMIKKNATTFRLPLEKYENRLIVHLESAGKFEPNTAAIKINEVGTPIHLAPDLKNSHGIIIKKLIGK